MHTHHHPVRTGKVLRWSLGATAAFVLIEALSGLQAQSLALLSDAGHNFTDALALLLALLGFYFGAKPADESKTYGYQRAGVLAAFINALALLILSAYICVESVHRFREPREVNETTMFAVAGLGLILNGAIMWGLRDGHKHDLNVRAAFLHMLGDALGSVGILIGAWVIRETRWLWIDPALSLVIAALIVWTAWDVLKDSLNILLEGLPQGMRLTNVTESLRRVEGVLDVHDLHIWSLGTQAHALSCHVLIDDMPHSESETILRRINDVLCSQFHIHHTTIQFEHQPCALQSAPCSMGPGEHSHSH
ncbi:MAG: cation diffusion facilitator family transporter [Bryobacteraceae bacterium]|nr:cation diffusion facilitator family transporter [Bryobacteraceae bacterium]